VTTTIPDPWRPLGVHSLSDAADVLADNLGIAHAEARSRLQLVADNIGISGTELAELVLYREALAD
jgi:hypothetical protein